MSDSRTVQYLFIPEIRSSSYDIGDNSNIGGVKNPDDWRLIGSVFAALWQ
jgi:hypothetical protein